MVGARPDGRGGWEIAVVRYGRLAAAGVAARGVPPMPVIDALRAGAQVVLPDEGPLRGAPAEEVGLLYRWLTTGGTRLVRADPAVGGARPQRHGMGGVGAAGAAGRRRGRRRLTRESTGTGSGPSSTSHPSGLFAPRLRGARDAKGCEVRCTGTGAAPVPGHGLG